VWIELAFDKIEKARQVIDKVPEQHPFEMRYEQIETVDWESCTDVLEAGARRDRLMAGWS